jgi:hypothetical protein
LSEDGFKVYGGPQNVSVMWVFEGLPIGILNADLMWPEIGRWWLARVNVKGDNHKGKGIGTKMVELMKEGLVKRSAAPPFGTPAFKEILVAPGGYGSDEKKQWNFYVKNGFVQNTESSLLWRP